jgi:hypothetical protein
MDIYINLSMIAFDVFLSTGGKIDFHHSIRRDILTAPPKKAIGSTGPIRATHPKL